MHVMKKSPEEKNNFNLIIYVLIVSPPQADIAELINVLSNNGYSPRWIQVVNVADMAVALDEQPWDVLLFDRGGSDLDGRAALDLAQKKYPDLPFIIVSNMADEEAAVDLVRAGAHDFILRGRLSRLAPAIERELREAGIRRKERLAQEEIKRNYRTQTILNELLHLSLENRQLPELLELFIHHLTSLPWLSLEPKGAILLIGERPDELILVAHRNLPPALQSLCSRVPFGACLCGLAAQKREIIFVGHVDERHNHQFPGMTDHGHYCVPILSAARKLLGVFTLYTKDGSLRDPKVEETLSATASVLAGIIERKLMEDELRLFRDLVDSSNDAVFVIDAKTGVIRDVNDTAAQNLGYTRTELCKMTIIDIDILLPDQAAWKRHVEEVRKRTYMMREGVLKRKDGTIFPVEVNVKHVALGGKEYHVAVARDLSARKEAEKEREQFQAQFRQVQKLEAIGTLAGGIAHDFNNILSAVIGFTEIALDDIPKGSQPHNDMQEVLKAGKRARDLVRQILTFSRQEEEERLPLQIDIIFTEVVKLIRASIPTTIEIRQVIDPSCGAVLADPTEIHQVLMNLCTNAYHTMRDRGGVLELGLRSKKIDPLSESPAPGLKPGDYTVLSVADTGHGMDAKTKARIFDPFFTTKPVGEGTGMGLAVVYGIVTRLGGMITVESEPGKGSTFTIYLPCIVVIGKGDALSDLPAPIPTGTERILLVDDEPPIVEMCQRMLGSLGYKVTSRVSSLEALEAFRFRPESFDLVLTDYSMPHMTGLELTRELLQIRPDLPIILMTGYSEIITPEKADQQGLRALIMKPILSRELGETIRRVLDRL